VTSGTVGGLTGTAGTFIIPAQANRILMVAETANIRWRDDGGPVSANTGMLMVASGVPFEYSGNLSKLQFLSTGASALLNVSYYLDAG
jgi:hypothetical protein